MSTMRYFFFTILMLMPAAAYSEQSSFTALAQFGKNPGQLSASYYAPSSPNAMVVLLHGCVQQAQTLAKNSGFLSLAKANNVALLLPQQDSRNNIKSCFNWFSPTDTEPGSGETASIINMITTLKHKLSITDVYIAGLSAGGAMTSNLLIHYPNLFKGGAIYAGIPYPCANNLIKAIACMRSGPSYSAAQLVEKVDKANVDWPPLTVFTGGSDNIVHPNNAQVIAQQWALLTDAKQQQQTINNSIKITQWHNKAQHKTVQLTVIENLSHGIAVSPQKPHGGQVAPFVVSTPISGAIETFKFWNLNLKTST